MGQLPVREAEDEAGDHAVDPRPRDAVRVAERQERVLELAPRDPLAGAVLRDDRRQERRAGTSAVVVA